MNRDVNSILGNGMTCGHYFAICQQIHQDPASP